MRDHLDILFDHADVIPAFEYWSAQTAVGFVQDGMSKKA